MPKLSILLGMIDESEKELFRSAVDAKAPIDKDAVKLGSTNKRFEKFNAYSYITDANLSGSDIVSHAQSGVSPKVIKKMKRGEIDSAPSLDLHGQTITQACESMSNFIYHHQNDKFIQIIHGKGYNSENNMSVLKTQVVSFLKQHPQIMAFNSCPVKDGGTGAIFALLK